MSAIDSESSLRLKLLNFPLIIGVVYIHAYGTTISFSGKILGTSKLNYLTDFIRILISEGIARISVPLFFLISGYLFLAGTKWSFQVYGKKLTTRTRTLLVPFLCWTVFGVMIRYLGQSTAVVHEYFVGGGPLIADYSPFNLLNAVLGLTAMPEAYHFWFIRDLMLLMVLSPLIVLILEYVAIPFLAALFVVWISAKWPFITPDGVGVLFFSAGCYLAMKGKSLFALDRYGVWFFMLYIPILLADVIWYDKPFNLCLHRCGIVVGIVAVLSATKLVLGHERLKNGVLWLSGASFFVYAAHEPLLGILRIMAFQMVSFDWPYAMLTIYLLLPLTLIILLVGLHSLLTTYASSLLRIITGGR